jgi:6,7-dimethyl-8-ribityllumazine synthase
MKKQNLSQFTIYPALNNKNVKIAIIVSEWNGTITNALKEGALAFLKEAGISKKQIEIHYVPGSYELPFAASALLDADDFLDAVICLGCIIQGETRHFEFLSHAVTNGLMNVQLNYLVPVIFGVLTCDTMEQAQERAGGKHGNKGAEAAYSCLKMIELKQKLD